MLDRFSLLNNLHESVVTKGCKSNIRTKSASEEDDDMYVPSVKKTKTPKLPVTKTIETKQVPTIEPVIEPVIPSPVEQDEGMYIPAVKKIRKSKSSTVAPIKPTETIPTQIEQVPSSIEDEDMYVPAVKKSRKSKSSTVEAPAEPTETIPIQVEQAPSSSEDEEMYVPAVRKTKKPSSETAVPQVAAIPEVPKAVVKSFPSWADPEWKPIQKFKNTDRKFDISHWGTLEDFDDQEPEPVITSPAEHKIPETESIPEIESMSMDEARRYLETLPENDRLADALEAFDQGMDEIFSNPKQKKLHATVLALLSAHFLGLKDRADEIFKENKKHGLIAVNTILNQLTSRISQLPRKMIEKYQEKLGRLTGTAIKKLRPLKSTFYGPELIFVNNRAIEIINNTHVTIDEAEQEAQKDWNALEQLSEGLTENNPNTRLAVLQKGALSFLANGNFQDAKRDMVLYADAFAVGGIAEVTGKDDKYHLSTVFSDVHIDPEEEYEDLAKDFANSTFLETQSKQNVDAFNSIPESDRNSLISLIAKYGEHAIEFSQLQVFIRQNSGRDLDKEAEAKEKLQEVYNKIRNLSIDIFTLNAKYIKVAYETFKDLYIIDKTIEYEATRDGLETIPITVGQSASAGLAVKTPGKRSDDTINPRLKRIDESEKEYAQRQAHEKELADISRLRYLQNILASGDINGYLDRKRLYQIERRKTKHEREMARIRNPEYSRTNKEQVKWRKLATEKDNDPSSLIRKVEFLLKDQKSRTNDLFKRISESWLPEEELAELETSLMNIRIKSFQDEYNTIENFNGINKQVLRAFEYMISQIPQYFSDAKQSVHADKVSSARITFDMASMFSKYARSLRASLAS